MQHIYYAATGECFGEELDTDSDIVDCLLKQREKTFSNEGMNLHNEQRKQKETYISKKAYASYSTCGENGYCGKYAQKQCRVSKLDPAWIGL